MDGTSIKRASGSYFNKLFENSIEYNESSIEKALDLVKKLSADLGETELYKPLGQRPIFILTDGEVWDVEEVLKLVSENSTENRCFTIGIGRGCDAGLVEGIATSSCVKCNFVQEGDSISEKVIPQLQSSLYGNIDSFEIHIEGEGNDAFQTSPYPLPTINSKGSYVIYLRSKNDKKTENKFNKNF